MNTVKRFPLTILLLLTAFLGMLLGLASLRQAGGEYVFWKEPLAAVFFKSIAPGEEDSLSEDETGEKNPILSDNNTNPVDRKSVV